MYIGLGRTLTATWTRLDVLKRLWRERLRSLEVFLRTLVLCRDEVAGVVAHLIILYCQQSY